HDARRGGTVQGKELFKDVDDKLHGSVVIVEQHHLVEGGLFDLRPGFFNDDAGVGASGMLIGHGVFIWVAKQQHKPAMMVRVYSSRNNCLRARAAPPYDCAGTRSARSARAAVHSA